MKKNGVLFLLLICMLTACNQQVTNGSDKDIISSNGEDNDNDLYGLHDIPDEFLTISADKTVFDGNGITFSVPSDWKCSMLNAEDGSAYYFRHPEWGEKCEFSFLLTFAELFSGERTEQEYAEYLAFGKRENVQIDSFTREKVGGYTCRQVVSSYSLENTEFVRIDCNYIIVGHKLYHFIIEYPAAERATFEPIFNSIIHSIEFKTE